MTNHPNRTKPVPDGTPSPEEIKAARAAAGLTQREAATLIWYEEIAWKQWEGGTRRMHPCAWWAFQQRASALSASPKHRNVVTAAGIERLRESMQFDEIGVAVDFPQEGEKVASPRIDFRRAGVVVATRTFVDVDVRPGMEGVRLTVVNLEGGFSTAAFKP